MKKKGIAFFLALTVHLAFLTLPGPHLQEKLESDSPIIKPISIRLPQNTRDEANPILEKTVLTRAAPKVSEKMPRSEIKPSAASNPSIQAERLEKTQISLPEKRLEKQPDPHRIEGENLPILPAQETRREHSEVEEASEEPALDLTEKNNKVEGPGQKEDGAAQDMPSEILRINRMIHPIYPKSARRQNREGTVQLKVYILENGEIGRIELFESSGSSDLDEAAIDAVKKWRFNPASKNGTPMRHAAVIPIHFTLE